MKKKFIVIVTVLIILLLSFWLFLKTHPPIRISGMSTENGENPKTVVVDLENRGIANIHLKQVLVNTNQKPRKVKLGISRSNGLVTSGELDNPSKGISFHNIREYPIKTPPKGNYKYMNFDTIRNYGIAVYSNKKIVNIIIKYQYLGIPFEKKIIVDFG